VADTINVKYKITEDGSLGKVAKDAEKAAKSTKKATDATAQHNKAQKGVIGATSNSTKAFSKMTTGITGGLVPAYATLAANVFALTALFGALSKAASLRILEDGLIRVGNAAGQNLTHVAKGLRDITDAAISTETAMRATALAFSSGFSADQLNQLTKVAKGASVALGRDMTDALDRLVRGTAKLEPEILDELGIMVRLDDAVEKYATSLGKTGKDLTQFERSQAFLNATIEQGLKKFGQLADTAEVNPYDKLAAAFANLQKVGVNLLNTVVEPFVNYLSSNPVALTAAVTMFAGTIVKTLVPAISASADAARGMAMKTGRQAARMAEKTTQAFQKSAKAVSSFKYAPKSLQTFEAGLRNGTVSAKGLKDAIKTLEASEKRRQKNLDAGHLKNMKQKEAEIAQIRVLKGELQSLAAQQGAMGAAGGALGRAKTTSSTSRKTAAAFKMMEDAGPLKGFQIAGASVSKQIKDVGKASGAYNKLAASFGVAGNAAKLFGTAALNAIPVIGQIAMVASLAWPLVSKIFEKGAAAQAADEAAKSFKSFHGIAEQLTTTLALTTSNTQDFVATMRAQVGIIGQVRDGLKAVNDAGAAEDQENLVKKQKQINKIEAILEKNATLRERRAKGEAGFFESALSGEAIKQFERSLSKLRAEQDAIRKRANQVDVASAKVILDSAISNIQSNTVLNEKMGDDVKALQEVRDKIEEGMSKSELDELMKAVMGNKEKVINSIDTAKSAVADFNKEVTLLGAKNKGPFDSMLDKVNALNNELQKAGEEGGMGTLAFFEEAPEYKKILDSFQNTKLFDDKSTLSAAEQFQALLEKNAKTLADSVQKIKNLEAGYKAIGEFAKGNAEATKVQLQVEEKIRTTKLDAVNAELQNFDLLNLTEKQARRVTELQQQQVALQQEKRTELEKELMIRVQSLTGEQKLLRMSEKIAANQSKITKSLREGEKIRATIAKKRQGKEFTAFEESQMFSKNKDERKKELYAERDLKIQAIVMEYDLLKAQTKLQRERAKIVEEEQGLAKGTLTGDFDKILKKIPQMQSTALGALVADTENKVANLDLQELNKKDAARKAAISAAGTASEGPGGDTTVGRAQAFMEEGGFAALDKASEKVKAMKEIVDPMVENLKQFGPEGALAAAVAEGGFIISESFTSMIETIDLKAEGTSAAAEKLKFAAQAVSAVNAILSASSQMKIANIEKEIAAEKKRDGQSAASVAKIKAMEAKKEKAAKKAFEVNKKMQMAQVAIATAASIAHNVAAASAAATQAGLAAPAVFAGTLGTLNAVTLGIGAAQLALIASTSYQGGSLPSDTSGPSKISVGSRENTVDLSRANNPAGELAYARGESGVGPGMTDFRPAFTGYKHRYGGGYVVGEQGPELFMPDTSGTIVPADETEVVTQNAPVNVNFTIQAIDTQNMQEALTVQRGNIIEMIREAANNSGEQFLETVDTFGDTSQLGDM